MDILRRIVGILIAALLVLPVFFQLSSGGIFKDRAFTFESGGSPELLPIPVSVFAVGLGVLLIRRLPASRMSLAVFVSSVILFAAAAVAAGPVSPAKAMLTAQALLPMSALVLGEMYGRTETGPTFERTVFWILLLIVPANLICSWEQGYMLLSPYLYFFSIYQHLQYWPMVVVALSLLVCFRFRRSRYLLLLMPAAMVLAVASHSLTAIGALAAGLLFFSMMHRRAAVAVTSLALVAGVLYAVLPTMDSGIVLKMTQRAETLAEKIMPNPIYEAEPGPYVPGITYRLKYWRHYAAGISESPRTFLFGHPSPPDRTSYPSAHNYWLDLTYNFGAIALLPMLALIVWTAARLWKMRAAMPVAMSALAIPVAYLVLGESMLKVGMRQPYSGLITFFLWGLLVARLRLRGDPQRAAVPANASSAV